MDTPPVRKGGRKRRLLVALGLILATLAVAAWLFLGRGDGKEAETHQDAGPVVTLEPITMNLADGRLLKVAVALQLPLEQAEDEAEAEADGAVALDEILSPSPPSPKRS